MKKTVCLRHGETDFLGPDANGNCFCLSCAQDFGVTKTFQSHENKPVVSKLPIAPFQEPFPELERIYKLVLSGQDDQAIDVLFQVVDELLGKGDFDRVDDLIYQVDLDQLNTNLMVGLLSVTLSAKGLLLERENLVGWIEYKLLISDPTRTEFLLKGLR